MAQRACVRLRVFGHRPHCRLCELTDKLARAVPFDTGIIRRLLVKAKCATNLTALGGEIAAYERTDANHTRLTSVTDAAKNKFALAIPSFGKHKTLGKLLNNVLPTTVLSSFGLVKGKEEIRSSRPPLWPPRLLPRLFLLPLPLPFTRTRTTTSPAASFSPRLAANI